MKRIVTLFLLIAFVLSSVASLVVFADEKIDLRQSFEDALNGWKTTSSTVGDKFEFSTKEVTDGKQALRIYDDSTETASGIRSGNIKAEPGTKYNATGDIKLIEGDVTFYFRFYTSEKKQISQVSTKGKKGEWVNVNLTAISPDNTASFEVIVMTNTGMTGEAYLDNVTVTNIGKATQGEIDAANATSKSFEPNLNTKKGEVALSDSFENGLISWRTHSSAVANQFEIVETDATDGKKALRIWDDSDKTQFGVRSGYIRVKEFNSYLLNLDIKTIGGDATVYFRIYDNDKNQINVRSTKGKIGEWSTVSIPIESGYNSGYVEVIVTTTSAAMVGECFVDNIKIIDNGPIEQDLISGPMQKEINDKLENAKPGDVIEIPDGVYKDVNLVIRCHGEEGNPIILKAKK